MTRPIFSEFLAKFDLVKSYRTGLYRYHRSTGTTGTCNPGGGGEHLQQGENLGEHLAGQDSPAGSRARIACLPKQQRSAVISALDGGRRDGQPCQLLLRGLSRLSGPPPSQSATGRAGGACRGRAPAKRKNSTTHHTIRHGRPTPGRRPPIWKTDTQRMPYRRPTPGRRPPI